MEISIYRDFDLRLYLISGSFEAIFEPISVKGEITCKAGSSCTKVVAIKAFEMYKSVLRTYQCFLP